MELQEFLRLLKVEHGPNAKGEYTCRCPSHEDKTASLTVTEKVSDKYGNRRIFLCCHANELGANKCTAQSICQALGIKVSDLNVTPCEPDRLGRTAPRAKSKPDTSCVPGHDVYTAVPASTEKPQMRKKSEDLGTLTDVYSYTDADGHELFQVCRFERTDEDGKRQKTFRQRIHAPGDPKARKDGFVWSVPEALRTSTLYRLPAVMAAVKSGRAVYLVEGEKDVATMERLGHTATCNPGGAGKWSDGFTALLTGADVVILEDCDTQKNGFAGQEHAWMVATRLTDKAKRVRLVDMKAACPNMPDKGDISDMAALMGDRAASEALARQLNITKTFDPQAVKFWLTPAQRAALMYQKVPGYCADNGCISVVTSDGSKPLCNFVAIPRLELRHNDGVTESMEFVLDGWSIDGTRLPTVTVPTTKFDAMGWVTDQWGYAAAIMPGTTTKDKLRWAIKEVGRVSAARVTEYSHTGWRKIGGKWCYLYHGGAIGLEGVTVGLEGGLSMYRLDGSGEPGWESITAIDAAIASSSLRNVIAPHISIPLLGVTYLAPLREFLAATGIAPAFALFLLGGTGCRKSTAAALALSHYGNFTGKNLPASFNDTSNSVRKKAFLLKDAPIVVDDYHPVHSLQEKRQMEAMAQNLARAFGDGAERGRMRADGTLQTSMPPRSVAIISGEDTPSAGESGLARYYIVNVGKEDIPVGEALTAAQEQARKGYLTRCMAGYIDWLRGQADALPSALHDRFIKLRNIAVEQTKGQHGRTAEAIAHILLGYEMMLKYFLSIGLFDAETCGTMLVEAMRALTDSSKKQAADMEADKPTRIFLSSLSELLASRAVALKDISTAEPEGSFSKGLPKDMIGYMDDDYYYFMPQLAFTAVSKLRKEQNLEFPVSLKALYKAMRAEGILPGVKADGEATRPKWIDGRTVRLLWVPRHFIDGAKKEVEQISMMPVETDDLPEEWR